MYKYMATLKKIGADLLKPTFHNLIIIVLLLYLISETTIPTELFEVINEPMIKIVLITFCIYVMLHRPVLGMLLSITFYELTTRNHIKIIPSLQAHHNNRSVISSPYSYVKYETLPNKRNRIMRNLEQNKKRTPFETTVVSNMKSNYKDTPVKSSYNKGKPKVFNNKQTLEQQMIAGLTSNYNKKPLNDNQIQPVLSKQKIGNSI
jgi:hypothetical protein